MMLRSHDRFHSENGRRQILVVDDEFINRELLGNVLQSEYEVLYAADGREGLKAAREHRDTLSLILLDLMMRRFRAPKCCSASNRIRIRRGFP